MYPFRIKVIPTSIPTYLFLREIVVCKTGYNIMINRKIHSDDLSDFLNIVKQIHDSKNNQTKFHLLYVVIVNKLCNFATSSISLKKRL